MYTHQQSHRKIAVNLIDVIIPTYPKCTVCQSRYRFRINKCGVSSTPDNHGTVHVTLTYKGVIKHDGMIQKRSIRGIERKLLQKEIIDKNVTASQLQNHILKDFSLLAFNRGNRFGVVTDPTIWKIVPEPTHRWKVISGRSGFNDQENFCEDKRMIGETVGHIQPHQEKL